MFIPGATREQMDWFNESQRRTTSSDNAIRFRKASFDNDVTDLLPQVTVPTLVLHPRGDVVGPLTKTEEIAALVPNAKLVILESNNHLVLENEPAWQVLCCEIERFLADT